MFVRRSHIWNLWKYGTTHSSLDWTSLESMVGGAWGDREEARKRGESSDQYLFALSVEIFYKVIGEKQLRWVHRRRHGAVRRGAVLVDLDIRRCRPGSVGRDAL